MPCGLDLIVGIISGLGVFMHMLLVGNGLVQGSTVLSMMPLFVCSCVLVCLLNPRI